MRGLAWWARLQLCTVDIGVQVSAKTITQDYLLKAVKNTKHVIWSLKQTYTAFHVAVVCYKLNEV